MTPKDLPLPEPFEVFTEDEPNSIITGYTANQMRERDVQIWNLARKQALEEAHKAFYATGCDIAGIEWEKFMEGMK